MEFEALAMDAADLVRVGEDAPGEVAEAAPMRLTIMRLPHVLLPCFFWVYEAVRGETS